MVSESSCIPIVMASVRGDAFRRIQLALLCGEFSPGSDVTWALMVTTASPGISCYWYIQQQWINIYKRIATNRFLGLR